MKKIFEQIERENNENEYNRTTIMDRADVFRNTANRLAFDTNQANSLRIMETNDSSNNKNSYVNRLARENEEHFKRVINHETGGKRCPADLCQPAPYQVPTTANENLVYLQVKGKSQLIKEIEEIQNNEEKLWHSDALHKNEVT